MTSPSLVYPDSTITPAGGGLQGYLTASYADVVAAFGPPNSTNIDRFKMDVEWLLRTPAGPAWVYNWRLQLPPNVAVEDITEWHVGGQTAEVVDHVARTLNARASALRQDPTTRRLVVEPIDGAPGRPPAQWEPRHFAAGDNALFWYGSEGTPVVVEDATPDAQGAILISGFFGNPHRAAPVDLVHRQGCAPCEAFKAAWDAQQAAKRGTSYTPAAQRLADHLCEHALVAVSLSGLSCGHGDVYRLSKDALVPPWFHDALAGAQLTAPEGGWPNWARTCHPVDWPALIAAHPQTLVPDFEMLTINAGASWAAIAAAFAIARSADPSVCMDVDFFVAVDGRITVAPTSIFTSHNVSSAVAASIDQTLIAGGRPAVYLHDDDAPAPTCWPARSGWQVCC